MLGLGHYIVERVACCGARYLGWTLHGVGGVAVNYCSGSKPSRGDRIILDLTL